MFRRFLLSVLALSVFAAGAVARTTDTGKPTRNVFDNGPLGINPGDAAHWTKDTVYVIMEQVYVESTAVLTIDPGTVVKGMPLPPALGSTDTSALIICRGAKIFANGTKSDPIILTSALDTVDSQTDIPVDAQELWGGVLVAGQASITRGPSDEFQLEGLAPDPRNAYGASAGVAIDNDNSGVIRYVSIRHGGVDFSPTNEVNGLTLAGVGSGTTLEFVEVWSNGDDGFEWFGGRVNSKHLVSSYNEDDQFDWDQGYSGNNQFWFSYQAPTLTNSNHGLELDGAENPITRLPFAEPNVYNTTFIGAGLGGATADNDRWAIFRDNSGGYLRNSIITEFKEKVIEVPTTNTLPVIGTDLIITDNIWWRFGCNGGGTGALVDTPACVTARGPSNTGLSAYLSNPANNNDEVDPLLTSFNWPTVYNPRNLDPRPQSISPAAGGYPDPSLSDPFFTSVAYAGAFSSDSASESGTWLCGWTALAQYGFLTTVRGDLSGDGLAAPNDVTLMLLAVFAGSVQPHLCAADANCDGILSPPDVSLELLLVFNGNPLPCI